MKKLLLVVTIIAATISLIACSKNGASGNANGYGNPYGNQYGNYGSTPNDPRCANGGYPGFNYNQPGYQQGQFYGNQYYGNVPSNVNCIPQGSIYGGNPYYFQANYQMYLGTCDFRFAGRAQLCPFGYQCMPAFGSMGVCMRGY